MGQRVQDNVPSLLNTPSMKTEFDVLVNSYVEHDIGIDINFLSRELSEGLLQNIRHLQQENMMVPAGIGNDIVKDPHQQMRSDSIYWMDSTHTNIYEQEFLQLAQQFTDHLNESCYTGINSFEFHYAVYSEGSYYRKHTDSFKNDSSRKFSFINYLNKDWLEADGGQLWIHQDDKIQKILPEAQTAVFFKSDETEHEVTISNRERMSITGWLKRV